MAHVRPVRFGKYLLLDKIAAGGMAELFRAKMVGDEGFEKLIAIKKILPHLVAEKALIQAFIDEARLAAHLQHQNIVRTYDFGRMGNDFFIAMEFLFGKNLRVIAEQAAKRRNALGMDRILWIVAKMCAGLDYAHNLRDYKGENLCIIHRDISPPNVFLTYDGEVKIVDFGVAKAASQNTQTQMGLIKGKLAYMSPEQAGGESIDHRSDIFAIGAVLYELVTGMRMFQGETMQVLAKVRVAEFEPAENVVDGLPEKLCDVLRKALARRPEDRYQSCGDMLSDIEECIYEMGYRPSSRKLAEYMRELFAEEIPAEERYLWEVARLSDEEVDAAPADVEQARVGGVAGTDSTAALDIGARQCDHCGRTLGESEKACPDCDTRQARTGKTEPDNRAECRECGKPVDADTEYCPWCDARLKEPEPAPMPIPAPKRKKNRTPPVTCPSCGMHNPHTFKLCGHCGAFLEKGTPTPAAGPAAEVSSARAGTGAEMQVASGEEERLPVLIHANAGQRFVENSLDFVELAVTNVSGQPVRGLTVSVSGRLMDQDLVEKIAYPLPPGKPYPMRVSGFLPKTAGKDALSVRVEGSLGGNGAFFLVGSLPVEVGSREDAGPVNVNISAKGPLIVDMEDALPGRKQRGAGQAEERWVSLALFHDTERQDRESRAFPDACIAPADCPLGRDVLSALEALSPEEAPRATITCHNGFVYHVVCGATLLLGRKRGINHVPVHLVPEDQYEHQNVKVSRNHCRLFIRDNRLWVRDSSNNGTFLDGVQVRKNTDTTVSGGQILGIAGILDMRVDVFTDGQRIIAALLTRLHNKTAEHYVLAAGPVPLGPEESLPVTVHGAPNFVAALYHDPIRHAWFLRTVKGFARECRDVPIQNGRKIAFGPAKCVFTLESPLAGDGAF
ncbi:MAG: protein kinase domain-containing protein [Desulfatibacillaceae bacterium]